MTDMLRPILERKRRENARRYAHAVQARALDRTLRAPVVERGAQAIEAIARRGAAAPRIIAEVKMRSPSAGLIRARTPGLVQAIARQYAAGGAAAVSVLCDGPGFGGSPLDLRRAAAAVPLPLLFKEFVLDPIQIRLARAVGAHMVLLLVRALDPGALRELASEIVAQGMAPVVEAADEAELDVALSTCAVLIGVNARDLRSFRVDPERARRAIARIPRDRVAVHMSGITCADDLSAVADSRADAVLVGEGLMRAEDPAERLRAWLGGCG